METISRAEAKRIGETYYFTGEPCCYGHIAERTVHNFTCVECKNAKARGETLTLQQPLPACCICGAQVRAAGHATCSTECKQLWDEVKKRAKYELTHRKLCHGCGAQHDRFHKWFCSDECHKHWLQAKLNVTLQPFTQIPCAICGTIFYARPGTKVCSHECRKKWKTQQRQILMRRQVESGYIAEYNRKLRAKVAAAVAVARELDITPKPTPPKHPPRPKPEPSVSDERWLFDYMQMCKRPTHAGKCIVCETRLRYVRLRGPIPTKFCSYRCRITFNVLKARYAAGPKHCPHCDALWWRTNKHLAYCSTACAVAAEQHRVRGHNMARAQRPEVKQLKRRREREKYAVMLAFQQMGLLQQEKQQ